MKLRLRLPRPRLQWNPGPRMLGTFHWLTLVWGALFELVLLIGLYIALYEHWPNDKIDPPVPGNLSWFSELFFLPAWYILLGIGIILALFWWSARRWPFTLQLNYAAMRPWHRIFWQILTTEPLTKTERRIFLTWGAITLLFAAIFPLAMTRFIVQLAVQLLAIAESAVLLFGIWQFFLRAIRWIKRNPQQIVNVPLSAIVKFLISNRSRP